MPPEEDSVLQKMQVIYDDSTYAPYMSPTLSAKEKLQRALEMGEGEGDDENEDDGNEDDDTPTDDTMDFSNIFHTNETTDSSATA
jgi:hypothetical protein